MEVGDLSAMQATAQYVVSTDDQKETVTLKVNSGPAILPGAFRATSLLKQHDLAKDVRVGTFGGAYNPARAEISKSDARDILSIIGI